MLGFASLVVTLAATVSSWAGGYLLAGALRRTGEVSWLLAPLALALTATVTTTTGCMDFDGLDEPVEMSTYAGDWRDQVIYQVMIDRFEDGDYGINFNVDTSAQARWHGGDWAGLESQLD